MAAFPQFDHVGGGSWRRTRIQRRKVMSRGKMGEKWCQFSGKMVAPFHGLPSEPSRDAAAGKWEKKFPSSTAPTPGGVVRKGGQDLLDFMRRTMNEVTLESLARRVEALERALDV